METSTFCKFLSVVPKADSSQQRVAVNSYARSGNYYNNKAPFQAHKQKLLSQDSRLQKENIPPNRSSQRPRHRD